MDQEEMTASIPYKIYKKLDELGMLGDDEHSYNVGFSNYSKHFIQPWHIWQEWNLNPWDADVVKRILREKSGESRISDYKKIIHICNERLRQLKNEN